MPGLQRRNEREKEMMAILLLIFATEDMGFWLSDEVTPQWFEQRLRDRGIQDRLMSTSIQARDQLLRDLNVEIEAENDLRKMRQRAEFYRHDLAGRLARRHREWLDQHRRQQAETARRRQAGEPVDDTPDPTHDDIYPQSWAEREVETTVTEWVTQTETEAARQVEAQTGRTLVAVWKTRPHLSSTGPCPICRPLDGTTKESWPPQFPDGPPAHPRCVCELIWRWVID